MSTKSPNTLRVQSWTRILCWSSSQVELTSNLSLSQETHLSLCLLCLLGLLWLSVSSQPHFQRRHTRNHLSIAFQSHFPQHRMRKRHLDASRSHFRQHRMQSRRLDASQSHFRQHHYTESQLSCNTICRDVEYILFELAITLGFLGLLLWFSLLDLVSGSIVLKVVC